MSFSTGFRSARDWLDAHAVRLQSWSGFSRRGLLLFACACGALNSLLVFLVPHADDALSFNVYGFFVFAALFSVVWLFDAVRLASHALVVFSAVLLALVVLYSGGVNSPNIAWMPVIPIAALMLIGVRWAIVWLVWIVLLNVFQFCAVELNWVSGLVVPDILSQDQAILSRFNVLVFLILAIVLYDWMRTAKLRDLAARNTELLATHAALREAQSHRDDFIAAMGHELRTPMNAILGLNSVLVDELSDEEDKAAIAVHIRKATEHLLRVVNDILDISQLEAGRLVVQSTEFSLATSLQSCMTKFEPAALEKGLRWQLVLDPALPVVIEGDKLRFEQVLNHLLDNAVKFTPEGGVEVRCTASGEMVRIEVQDTGLGIDPAFNQAIFNRFALASEGVQRMYGGAGLGLSISDRLVSLLGGRMGLSTPETGGALFWFDLPLRAARLPLDLATPFSNNPQFPVSVLVVDDNPVNVLVVEILLKKLWPHCVIHKASNGEQALSLCQQSAFTVVLMDLVMPVMDGLEATRRLLGSEFKTLGTKPCVIGLTAHSLSSETQACLTAGMHAVLGKPIDPQAMVLALQRYLGPAIHGQ